MRLRVALTVGLALAVSACSTRESGTPSPSTTASDPSMSTGASPAGRAPRVAHPLDALAFTKSTCLALTASDLVSLDLTGAHGRVTVTAGSPACTWQKASTTTATDVRSDAVAWLTPDTDGLSDLYAQKSTMAYFVVTSVDEYPAVYADVADLRTNGSCFLNVGVNDHLYFFVDYERNYTTSSEANAQQSCGAAEQTAAAVIRNLRSRQGS